MDGDYYSALYTWFEKCGIISNVRTHLRQNLVNALKSKDTTLSKDNTSPKSAKQYVYDLLIAEYLWNHSYTYTLSVFASEAPLLVNFSKNLPNSDSPDRKEKLQNDYVQHTLETLGIQPQDLVGQHVIKEYTDVDTPLLLAILKCLSQSLFNAKDQNNLDRSGQSSKHNCETQTDGNYKSSLEYSKLAMAKKKLIQQKEIFAAELTQKEDELRRQASVMELQMTTLNDKLARAQNLMHLVNLKEKKLSEDKKEDDRRIYRREIELSTKEDLLVREAERLQKERDSYRKFESDLKKLQDELTKVKKELPTRESDRNLSYKDMQVQTDTSPVDSEKATLNRERDELMSLIRVQQSRIEELTKRTVSLSRQLEEAQITKRPSIEIPTTVVRFSKTSTFLSESSSTEDILHDAKMRLRRLEEESLKADQCYFNCITTSPL
ncbi:centrosomal protein of 63 kDa-like [Venturia canescens]|uniref:centrosomal protein of 63 kDa-like n=1 Tax=Venturia canescens TaxID=32260 RepID=UPI001C9CF4B9|nr:centrosomal protein of 63 kDa-like [Venturia canescens]